MSKAEETMQTEEKFFEEKKTKASKPKEAKQKKIVVPGELLTEERKKAGQNTIAKEGKIYSNVLGLLNESGDYVSVVSLNGKYLPRMNDLVVGIIIDEKFSGYTCEVNSFWDGYISKDNFSRQLTPGAVISAKIRKVTETNDFDLDDARVFFGGDVAKIGPVKVPRLIGKNGSMLNVLKDGTGCSFMVGRNGLVWINGDNTALAIKAIKKIETEAHTSNLTNKMAEYLKKENKGKKK